MSHIDAAYSAFCTNRFPVPTEAQLTNLEQRIGVKLPPDYRRFLLDYNGGFFSDPDIVPVVEGCPEDGLSYMHGIGAAAYLEEAEFASPFNLQLFDNNDPPEVIPVGSTVMGNLVLLITHPEENGAFVLKRAFSTDFFFLAENVESFFALLREPCEQ